MTSKTLHKNMCKEMKVKQFYSCSSFQFLTFLDTEGECVWLSGLAPYV